MAEHEGIKLTVYGEMVYPCIELTDEDNLLEKRNGCIVGHHSPCGISRSSVELRLVSDTHYALTCLNCKMRVVVPIAYNTIPALRRWAYSVLLAAASRSLLNL